MLIVVSLFSAVARACVDRSEVLTRGMAWVNSHVPYSQTGSYQGYRTDCSGFASMCWKLSKPGMTTRDFVPAKVCSQTTKENLAKGDFMLSPDHHVAVFIEWANAEKTEYWLMEEQGTQWGTVKRKQTYPYGSATGFFPCKVVLACESRLNLRRDQEEQPQSY